MARKRGIRARALRIERENPCYIVVICCCDDRLLSRVVICGHTA